MFYVSTFLNNSCYPAFLSITRFFYEAAAPYQEALRQSGYTFKLEFKPPPQQPPSEKRKRRRNVVRFSPPYNKNVKTNIGLAFISLIERSFPAGHNLTKQPRNKKETYIGLTATQFKARYRNHLMSFRHEKRRNETELSKHLWQLKEANKEFNITWKILAKAKSYTNLTKRCNLCTTEKFFLICRPHMATLNKRNELVSTCRHRRKFILRYN